MDKATQKSIIDSVNSIVNKEEQCNECEMFDRVETALELFEELFQVELTEEQEELLIDIGFTDLFEGNTAKPVNLEEDVQTIINEHSPQEVFSYLVEVLAALPALARGAAAAASVAGRAGAGSAAGGARMATLARALPLLGSGAQSSSVSSGPEGTADAWGQLATLRDRAMQMIQQPAPVGQENTDQVQPQLGEDGRRGTGRSDEATRARELIKLLQELKREGKTVPVRPSYDDPRSRRMGYGRTDEIREDVNLKLKKKKKVFKIIFVDKGVKKKGTAVSHKGVMRIVSGKSSFKVFDEKNNDVTSQFKHGKSHNKNDKK